MNPRKRFLVKDTELSGQIKMEESSVKRCGFCSMLSSLLRRAMCVSSRRGSSESYYRELGDQDTLLAKEKESCKNEDKQKQKKLEDQTSELSVNVDAEDGVIHPDIHEVPADKGSSEELKMELRSRADSRFLTMNKRRKKKLITRSLQTNTALLDDLSMGQVQCILNQSIHWPFNAFTLDTVSGGRCLPVLCVHLFHTYGLISHFNLDVAKTWRLFSLIEEGYHSTNPYHNSIHAADVTQAMHCFLQQQPIRDYMQPLEIMASLLAAMAHDLDHPGVNQPFLIATSNHLAKLYKNTSVLENHHWRSAISCLIESGLLDQMQESRAQLEHQISSLILATDITRQQEYLSQFKNHLDTDTLDMKKADHRHLVLQIALKCADISNPCRPWEISRKWSLKVCEEFFRQGDYERQLNLPVSGLCDRHSTSIPKIQTGFFKFVVTPLITEWDRFLSNDLSSQMLRNLLYNQNKWDSLVAQEQANETWSEISDADMVNNILETDSSTNISDSSELLLPLRRGSLNPVKQGALKEHLRRFSVPLNVFQDYKFKNRGDKSNASSLVDSQKGDSISLVESDQPAHSKLQTPEKILSPEKLLPESSIASITTPVQASRLKQVIRDGVSWKLVRQQTFPPLETVRDHDHTLASRSLHTSNEDALHAAPKTKVNLGARRKEGKFSNFFNRADTDKAEGSRDKSQNDTDTSDSSRNLYKESGNKTRESIAVGSQLRDNLTSVQLGVLGSDHLLRRRKSMPAEVLLLTPKEKKFREMSIGLPQLLHRTISSKDCWIRRRGSAPLPVAPSELRRLGSLGSLRQSVNGARRKVTPIVICNQCLSRTTYDVPEHPFPPLPRRSSLPVEGNRAERMQPADGPK